jgi:FkbM family methyltransferase
MTTPQVFSHLLELSYKDLLPTNHFNYLKKLKEEGFEPKVIYDIGSCVLHWTKKAKELWPNATYILFDAFREAEFLYSEYKYHMGVLCDQDKRELRFYKNIEHPGGNSYFREIGCENGKYFPEDRYTIEIGMTLDTIVKERGFPLPDLIKIDVQGAEKDIISGGKECMLNATHLICEMQHTNYNDGAPKVSETHPYIESLGWECVAPMLHNNGPDADYGFKNLMRK